MEWNGRYQSHYDVLFDGVASDCMLSFVNKWGGYTQQQTSNPTRVTSNLSSDEMCVE